MNNSNTGSPWLQLASVWIICILGIWISVSLSFSTVKSKEEDLQKCKQLWYEELSYDSWNTICKTFKNWVLEKSVEIKP